MIFIIFIFLVRLKAEKRLKDQQRKQRVTENRKHLANVRVVQKNLVFVVGLPLRLADADVSKVTNNLNKILLLTFSIFVIINFQILKRHEYFGKFGKIHKVVINQSTSYAGSQGPSASAYVTYQVSSAYFYIRSYIILLLLGVIYIYIFLNFFIISVKKMHYVL